MPEGDTIHRAAAVVGAALTGKPLRTFVAPRLRPPFPAIDETIGNVEARGKHLLLHFGDGFVLHTHLRMTGTWRVRAPSGTTPRALAVVGVEDAVAVCSRAPTVELLDVGALRRHPVLRRLGPDLTVPGVDVDEALRRLGRSGTADMTIGDALLDQQPACGIGNVIMQESCFLEGLDPRSPLGQVTTPTRRALYDTAARLLQENVSRTRRTTVPDSPAGSLFVYNRSRRPCRVCGTPIVAARTGRNGRPTWWCPSCQPGPG